MADATKQTRTTTVRLTRREFVAAASVAGAAICGAAAQPDVPILDLHQHVRYNGRPNDRLLGHQQAHNITTTVLLAGAGWMLQTVCGDNRECAAFVNQHRDRFVMFASSDPAESRTVDVLRGNISRGARGIGEMKYHVAVDSPEM